MKHPLLYILLLASPLLTACTSETIPDGAGGYSHVRLSIGPSRLGGEVQQRATWSDAAATDGEMMHQACVVAADAQGKVVAIKHITAANGESERETVELATLPNGTYTFYNFGNIAPTAQDDADPASVTIGGLTFKVGEAVPEGINATTSTARFDHYNLGTEGIPMTNIETHAVNSDVTITLQLYRMLSKVRFYVSNLTQSDVQISHITIGEVTTDGTPIYLFPQKDEQDQPTISWPDAAQRTTADFDYYNDAANPFALSYGQTSIAMPDQYLNESQTAHVTGRFPLSVTMKRRVGGVWTDDEAHALITLARIPRNTMVTVPLSLTDYVLNLEAFFYPPIGGYPAFSMEKHKDEYYATFHGAGNFMLQPQFYRFADAERPENWIQLNDRSMVEDYSLRVNDPQHIFTTAPHIDTTTGEILGALSGTPGRAYAQLTLLIRVSETQTLTYNRTIFFIAE